ncbi:SDR family oxidoreductase [Roseovarius amoyensis]|uniref:SDR family oxidoreductase n=1 Tax=Roseovarius amoyensis TaxID=2211448 RepID=UPI000DBE68DD|nr:SDR family oxidoreductase [Roseovarius amoyensis]
MKKSKLLVAGALGVVGRSVLEHFERLDNWDVVGLSRREYNGETKADWRSVDLRDAEACDAGLGDLSDITHIAYCAVYEKADVTKGWSERDHVEINLSMLQNLVRTVQKHSPVLKQISVLQGTKAYGGHLGPFKMPARETDARSMGPNFYYDQMDWLAEEQHGKDWTWTIFRPQIVCGAALGSPLNIVSAIGAYAAISKEQGLPLRFPGGPERVGEATDARLIAKGIEWACDASAAANQIYNITNGDVFIWHNLWPRLADFFGMDFAPPQPMSLARIMPENTECWDRIVARHGLVQTTLRDMVPDWRFADFLFGYGQRPNPHHMSTIKIRQHGFGDCIDSEDMFIELLGNLQNRNIIPRS